MTTRTLLEDRWITIGHAVERTGFGEPFFHEHTSNGTWAEGVVWKWVLGRKVIDLQALYSWIDKQPSVPSNRGRRKPANDQCHAPQAA